MPLDLATAARHADGLSHRKRLLAAEMLAAGDPLVRVAAAVEVDEAVMRVLDVDDGFRRLVDACRALQEMPREAYRERAERLLRGAAERALADGRVSTVNLILRTTRALDGPAEDLDGEDGAWNPDDEDEREPDGPLSHLPIELIYRLNRAQLLDGMLANDGSAVREAFRAAERAADAIAADRSPGLPAADEPIVPREAATAAAPSEEVAPTAPPLRLAASRDAGIDPTPATPRSGPPDLALPRPGGTDPEADRPDPFPFGDEPRPQATVTPFRRAKEPVPEWHGHATNPRRPRPP